MDTFSVGDEIDIDEVALAAEKLFVHMRNTHKTIAESITALDEISLLV